MKKMPGMYSCQDVNDLVTRGTVEDLNMMDRLRFKMHLMMCHHCARFVRQIRALGDSIRKVFGMEPDPERCRQLEEKVMANYDGHRHD